MWSKREKWYTAIAILEKLPFLKGNKIISYFDGSNNIFIDCISIDEIWWRCLPIGALKSHLFQSNN